MGHSSLYQDVGGALLLGQCGLRTVRIEMQKIFKVLTNLGLAGFLIWTGLLVIIYFAALWDKIARPQYKNMNSREVVYFGLLAILFIVLDVLIVRRFMRLLRRSNDRQHKL